MINLQDQVGTWHSFPSSPVRIISLVPSLSELLCDLDLHQQLVGITKFCIHPNHLKSEKMIVGGTKKVNVDKIQLLLPDIIIANKEENTLQIVEDLQKIAPVWVTDISTINNVTTMISSFGIIFNRRMEAQKWIGKISFAHNDFMSLMSNKPSIKAAYFIWKNPYMVAGSGTFINEMLVLNRFDNIYQSQPRYPEIQLENMRSDGDPELILLSSEPYPFKDEDAFEIGRFTHHAKVIYVDGEMFSWYGSRLVKAFQYFRRLQETLN